MAGNGKFVEVVAGSLTERAALGTSAGAGDVDELVKLDATGKLDQSFMPTGVGQDTIALEASETLSAGDFVNIYDSTGAKCRKADATAAGKEAHGFVLASVTAVQTATIYPLGTNSSLTTLTVGSQYFLDTTAGGVIATAPSATGNIVQKLGTAFSTTELATQIHQSVVLV